MKRNLLAFCRRITCYLICLELLTGCDPVTKEQPPVVAATPTPVVPPTDTTLLTGYWKPVGSSDTQTSGDGNIFRFENGVHTLYYKNTNELRIVYTDTYNFADSGRKLQKRYSLGGTAITALADILLLTSDSLILKGTGPDALPGEKAYVKLKNL